jgi:hypothetical protein
MHFNGLFQLPSNKFDHIDNPSCLQALYESDKENVMSKCTIHVTKSHLVVKQL